MNCEVCGADEVLPFVCSYCGRTYCGDHRLPENHNCTELWRAHPPSKAPMAPYPSRDVNRRYPIYVPVGGQRLMWFGKSEVKHLLAGIFLVVAVGLSFLFGMPIWAVAISVGLFAAAFIIHELAHKFVAQFHGLWAEFRVNLTGAMLTLISVFSPFKIIAPGAVVITGQATLDLQGRIALAGPATNILSSAALLATSLFTSSFLSLALFYGAYINAAIAVFNLIPFAILDGQKIFSWNRMIWLVIFSLSLALLISILLVKRI